jgi:ABC-type sugar transport system ATPase subunit
MNRITLLSATLLLLFSFTFALGAEKKKGAEVKLQFTSWMVAEASGGEVWLPERIGVWEKAHPGVEFGMIPDAVQDLSKYMDEKFRSTLVSTYKGGQLGDKMVGLVDAGRTEMAETIIGIRNGGEIDTRKPEDAVDHGIDYLD